MCIASAISLLMILICGMATYGAYKVNECVTRASFPGKRPGGTETLRRAFLSAARCLDYPIFLLPNIRLCSQHPGGRQHRGLPQHRTGLPAAAGRKRRFRGRGLLR